MTNPSPARLQTQTSTSLDLLRGVPDQLAAILLAFRRDVRNLQKNRDLSVDALTRGVIAARQRATTAADGLETAAMDNADKVRAAIANVRPQPTGNDALLARMEKDNAWRRVRELMQAPDAQRNPFLALQSIITDAGARGDRYTLDALREELPSYLAARGGTTILKDLLAHIARTERPAQTEVEQAAGTIGDELETGMANVSAAFKMARQELAGDSVGVNTHYTVSNLPGWRRGTAVAVADGKLNPATLEVTF